MKSMLVNRQFGAYCKLIGDFFEKRGWFVVPCNDRDSAMDVVAGSEPYDIVLLGY